MTLRKVISGGQTGVDQGALVAARACGLLTGGWAPLGFRTLEGSFPALGTIYGLKEHWSEDYPPRTKLNVEESDGTLRLAKTWTSAGEICTMKAIIAANKPSLSLHIAEDVLINVELVVNFIQHHKIECLNVAGNAEKTAPGIFDFTCAFLAKVFELCKSNA